MKKIIISLSVIILILFATLIIRFDIINIFKPQLVNSENSKTSENKYSIQFETNEEVREPGLELVAIPDLSRFYSITIEGTTSVKEITERRRFVDEKQRGIRRTENIISEGAPTVQYFGEEYDTLFPAYLRNRIAEIYGKESPFTFRLKDNYGYTGAADVSYNNKRFVTYQGPISWFEYTPDLELFLLYGELIGVEDLEELENVYNDFVVNRETYLSETLEIDYEFFTGRLVLLLPPTFDWFEDAALVQNEINKTNAYIKLHYSQEEIDGWYEKYGVRESYD